MKIYTKLEFQMTEEGLIPLEETAFEYEGKTSEAKGGGSTTTVQNADPWSGQQPYLKDLFKNAESLYKQDPGSIYPGPEVVPYNAQQIGGQNFLGGYAQGPAIQTSGNAQNALNFSLADVLNPASNPALAAHAQGAIQPAVQAFQQQIMPSIQDQFIGAGQFGGSRQGVAEGIATDGLTRNVLNTTAGIYSDAYGKGLDTMMKGLALTPQTLQVGEYPGRLFQELGAQNQSMEQQILNSVIGKYYQTQQLPWDRLSQYSSLINGLPAGLGTTTAKGPGPQSGGIAGAAGGALTGAAAGSAIAGTTYGATMIANGWNPVGWGMALGALAGFM